MTLTRWSPTHDLAAAEIEGLNHMFDLVFTGEPLDRGGWVPAVDIYETPQKDVVFKIDLPEMKRDDIKVTVENNLLTIAGERKAQVEQKGQQIYRQERLHGAFERSFTVPASVDAGRVDASFQDGVLTLTLPRREEAKPKQIKING